MSDIFYLLKPLLIIGFAFAITLGLMSPKRLPKIFAIWIFCPLLFAILLTYLKGIFVNLGLLEKIIFIGVLGVIALVVITRLFLGKHAFEGLATHFIYDILKFIILLPFKILRGIFSIFFKKR